MMIFIVSCGTAFSFQETISNDLPRRVNDGQIIDAHDGCLQCFEGRFFLYGTAYGTNDGYGLKNRFRVYSSNDLKRWEFDGELLSKQPAGVYYRPYVVFNARTRKYVLWYNWYPKLWNGQEGVAVSDTPTGPFTIISTNILLAHPDSGDGSLFVDDDTSGYFIYTALREGGTIRVERLTPDYLAATGETSGVLAIGTEAPVLFRRNNLYYALCGPRCAFCSGGSEVQVLKAVSPIGPFTTEAQLNINHELAEGAPSPSAKELWAVMVSSANSDRTGSRSSAQKVPMIIRTMNRPLITAQETWVAKIPTCSGPVFLWMADRWGSSPDGIKGHDFQYWSPPLEFNANGDILPMENVAQWRINLVQKNGDP